MRDVERRDLRLLDDTAQLVAQSQAQLGVEVRERLVEQQDARLVDQRAGKRDTLHLPAGELRDGTF